MEEGNLEEGDEEEEDLAEGGGDGEEEDEDGDDDCDDDGELDEQQLRELQELQLPGFEGMPSEEELQLVGGWLGVGEG